LSPWKENKHRILQQKQKTDTYKICKGAMTQEKWFGQKFHIESSGWQKKILRKKV
jgi:hypothetical protein